MYEVAAPLLYASIELFCLLAERFLTGPLSPRNQVRRLRISVQLKDDLELFETLFPSPLYNMLEHGKPRELEIVIGTKGPRKTPMGPSIPDNFPLARLRTKDHQHEDTFQFLAQTAFQNLLALLADPRFVTVRLGGEEMYHLECWCPFHEQQEGTCHPYAGHRFLCREDLMGGMSVLELEWRRVVEAFFGAKVAKKIARRAR